VPLLFQKLFAKYYYASAYRYADCYLGPTHDLAYTDPAAVHLLSTESLEALSVGCQRSRVEKTARLSDFEASYRFLNVCSDPGAFGVNCSTCSKCCRTLLTLELLGKIDEYGAVFDLSRYSRARDRYIVTLLANPHESFNNEILEFANSIGYRFSRRHRIVGALRALYRRGHRAFDQREHGANATRGAGANALVDE
jgi:hypothetical protein